MCWRSSPDRERPMVRLKRSTAGLNICAGLLWGSVTSPTTSPGVCSSPVASDRFYTLNYDEPDNIEGAEPKTYEQLDQAYLAVESGSADAVLYDQPNVAYYIRTEGEDKLKMVGDLQEAQDYGIAISKGNENLVAAVNESLANLKDNGKYAEMYKEWFGEELPSDD